MTQGPRGMGWPPTVNDWYRRKLREAEAAGRKEQP
jgi:hypothetical protein